VLTGGGRQLAAAKNYKIFIFDHIRTIDRRINELRFVESVEGRN
jgi:hypothetical protein